MSRLSIDAQDLIMALENHGEVFQYFVDLQTGEVVFLADEAYVGKADDDLELEIEADPERYRAIDSLPSFKGWQVMADFIEQLPSGKERVRLTRAVQQSNPFRRFKNALLDYPRLREEWFAFHESAMIELALEWLRDEGIEADLSFTSAAEA